MNETANFNSVLIYTDGACSGNPGPGGWGAIVATPEGHVTELGGQGQMTTNNQMEAMAALSALKFAKNLQFPIVVYTDSTYLIRGITQWIWGWKKKGWKNSEGGDVANRDLWEALLDITRAIKTPISWKYVRGHTQNPGNERCDEIAVKMTERNWVDLYSGPLIKYPVAIYDLPPDVPLPEMRQKQEKQIAHSYLSLLNGKVVRHQNWKSCETRVKGKSGAKFKKAMVAEEETQILITWGLPPGTKISDTE